MENSGMMNDSTLIPNDLSLLAFKSALQLNALRRNMDRPSDVDYLAVLVERLKDSFDDEPSEQRVRRLAPPDVEVWSKAVEAYSGGQTPSYDQLAFRLKDILITLQNREAIQGENIKKLIEFCTSLHSALLQQRSFIEQSRRPKNPRRY